MALISLFGGFMEDKNVEPLNVFRSSNEAQVQAINGRGAKRGLFGYCKSSSMVSEEDGWSLRALAIMRILHLI
jgi:hypothetical protein